MYRKWDKLRKRISATRAQNTLNISNALAQKGRRVNLRQDSARNAFWNVEAKVVPVTRYGGYERARSTMASLQPLLFHLATFVPPSEKYYISSLAHYALLVPSEKYSS